MAVTGLGDWPLKTDLVGDFNSFYKDINFVNRADTSVCHTVKVTLNGYSLFVAEGELEIQAVIN